MEPMIEMLNILKRCAELESGLEGTPALRVTEEREIHALRERLLQYPHTVSAILQVAQTLHRPVDTLQLQDVQRLI